MLAEKLGYASVNKMLGEMSSMEITEWQAFFEIKEEEQKKEEVRAKARR